MIGKRLKSTKPLLTLFISLLFLTVSTCAFGASKIVKVGTSDVIEIAEGVTLELSSNSLNDYAQIIIDEKEVWELQKKAEEEEWKAIEDDEERLAAELAWKQKWEEYEEDWKWRCNYCKITAKMKVKKNKVRFKFGPHDTYFTTPAVKLKIASDAISCDYEYPILLGENEEIEPDITEEGIEWRIPHFSIYYFRRR